ncbi:MAG: carboxypeptidase regulatory-like domain-containing protein, partial [Planctomycetaceae bacterium]
MSNITRSRKILAVALCAIAAGCGGATEGPKLYPTTGVVMYNGSPLAGAKVTFLPDAQAGVAMGTTGADGKFTLTTGSEPGVAAGNSRVTVIMMEDSGTGLKKDMTPEDMQKLQMEGKLAAELKKL